ncbi:MAG TPA: hypothetical protein VK607_06010, partial [Kofleriaceae bacterium]|nr:hypothetical protein [Kofleriaceae bacterium]
MAVGYFVWCKGHGDSDGKGDHGNGDAHAKLCRERHKPFGKPATKPPPPPTQPRDPQNPRGTKGP